MSSKRNILVTGSTGFIGANAVRHLLGTGWNVKCLVRRDSDTSRLPSSVKIVEGSLLDESDLAKALRGCRAVLHLAGIIRAKNLTDYLKVNRDATASMAIAARKAGIEKFLLCSSLAAGGPERYGRPRRNSDPSEPITDYGRSKLAGEEAVRGFAGDVAWTIIRPPAVFGPFDHAFLSVIKWIKLGFKLRLGDGGMRFSIIHAEDLAAAFGLALETDYLSGASWYVSDGGEWTLADMTSIIERTINKKAVWISIPRGLAPTVASMAEFISGFRGKLPLLSHSKVIEFSQSAWTCESTDFRNITGFRPRYDLITGMTQTIGWYKENGWI